MAKLLEQDIQNLDADIELLDEIISEVNLTNRLTVRQKDLLRVIEVRAQVHLATVALHKAREGS